MSGYIGNIPVPQATQTRDVFTASAGQTSFATSGYTPGFVDVYLNGVKLVDSIDFTATNGSDVVLTTGATAGDTVEVLSYSTYEVNAQTYTGGLTVNNDAATVLTVDRATSDGTLVDFKKDGTSVGGVGVDYGTEFYVGGGGSGFYLNTATIRPTTGGAASTLTDGTIDFGYPTARWKDLYLSGGVYLGGPVSANLLDDYEEGTWTPTLTDGSTTISGGSILGTYTKIGRLVHTRFSFINPTTNLGLSGTWQISNLPFSIQGQSNEYIGGFVTYNRNISMSGNWMSLWSFINASYFQLRSHYMNGTESSSKGGTVPAQMLFSGEMIYHTS